MTTSVYGSDEAARSRWVTARNYDAEVTAAVLHALSALETADHAGPAGD